MYCIVLYVYVMLITFILSQLNSLLSFSSPQPKNFSFSVCWWCSYLMFHCEGMWPDCRLQLQDIPHAAGSSWPLIGPWRSLGPLIGRGWPGIMQLQSVRALQRTLQQHSTYIGKINPDLKIGRRLGIPSSWQQPGITNSPHDTTKGPQPNVTCSWSMKPELWKYFEKWIKRKLLLFVNMIRQQFDFISKTFWLQASACGRLEWVMRGAGASWSQFHIYFTYIKHKTCITMYYVYLCRYNTLFSLLSVRLKSHVTNK